MVGGGPGRAEGPGPCVVRSRLLLPQVRPSQWNVRPSRARLPLRLKFRIANGRVVEGGGGEVSAQWYVWSPPWQGAGARFPLDAENLESRNKF